MTSFLVPDMTCGHCTASIAKAVNAADPSARVQIDLATHRVAIESATVDAATLSRAIADAGFTPEPTESVTTPAVAPARKGCCCG